MIKVDGSYLYPSALFFKLVLATKENIKKTLGTVHIADFFHTDCTLNAT